MNNSKSVCFLIKPFHIKLQVYTHAPGMFTLQSLKATTDLSRNGKQLQVHTLTHAIFSLCVRLPPTFFDNWPFRHAIVASVTYAKSKIACSKTHLHFFSKFLFIKLLFPECFFFQSTSTQNALLKHCCFHNKWQKFVFQVYFEVPLK